MGEKFFSVIQYGKEAPTAQGTAVAADTIWVGQVGAHTSDRKISYPVEQFKVRAESNRSVVGQRLVIDTLMSDHGTFQQLPMILSGLLKGGVTPVEQNTSQGDYLWDFTPSLTAGNALDSFTIEKGDDTQAWEAEYCMFERLTLSGQINQDNSFSPVNIEAAFFGRQWTETTFTAALSLPNTNSIDAILSQLYIDTAWSAIGGTEKAGILRDFSIEILGGAHPKFHGGSNRYFDAHDQGLISIMGNFTFEGNSTADTIWDAKQAQTEQFIRFKLSGDQIGSGDVHSLVLDMGGTWEDVIPMASEDRGNNLHTAVFHAYYDSVGAKLLQAQVTTNVSAI